VKTVCFVTVHWCQSWGAQSAWCPQHSHWGACAPPGPPWLRRLCWYLLALGPQQQTRCRGVRRPNDRTEGQTDIRQFHRPCSTYYASRANSTSMVPVWRKKDKAQLHATLILSVYPGSLWFSAVLAPFCSTACMPSSVPAVPMTNAPRCLAIWQHARPTWTCQHSTMVRLVTRVFMQLHHTHNSNATQHSMTRK